VSVTEEGAGAPGGAPLGAEQLPALLESVHTALAAQRERIDELNVFPVPDGDTGTNMTLTVRAGLDALRAEDVGDAEVAARALIRGAIRGARGNSGVILSQVVRAMADVVTSHREIDATRYAAALDRARQLAYEAVAQPVEGTILTVIAAAATEAAAAAADGDDLVATSARVRDVVHAAVERTRDQLDVLRDAGVVDAGARGFEVVVSAVHAHLTGQATETIGDHDHPDVARGPYRQDDACEGSLAFGYEVQYLLEADDDAAPGLRLRLEVLGDSVVVVAAGGLLKVHVHTDDVGAAIEEGVVVGTPSDIAVTHFGDQLADLRRNDPPAAIGAVAVVSGAGAHALVRSMGAVSVDGAVGQVPSVADLLNACGGVRAGTVVLLPGHPDAVPTARQASDVAVAEGGRSLEVVAEARTLPAVLAALALLDPSALPGDVLPELRATAAAVRCGEVVAAVRDAKTSVGAVTEGQPLAVVETEVVAAVTDPLAALHAVCDHLEVARAEIVTLLIGADATAGQRRDAAELVRELAADDAEVAVIDAGQRPARFVVGVE
jgi:DAK2 domain fusion protein YloV